MARPLRIDGFSRLTEFDRGAMPEFAHISGSQLHPPILETIIDIAFAGKE